MVRTSLVAAAAALGLLNGCGNSSTADAAPRDGDLLPDAQVGASDANPWPDGPPYIACDPVTNECPVEHPYCGQVALEGGVRCYDSCRGVVTSCIERTPDDAPPCGGDAGVCDAPLNQCCAHPYTAAEVCADHDLAGWSCL